MTTGKEGIEYSAELETIQTSKPLVSHIYTADPAAHCFDGKLYIYPSHDVEKNNVFDDDGGHFQMHDYHVFSMDDVDGPIVDHGVVLKVEDILWAEKQLWDSDVACKDGRYYMYYSAKDRNDIFHLGVAVSDSPEGPFIPEPYPILGSYSIDPCVFQDDDGKYYIYFGGIWGGQLQRYRDNKAIEVGQEPMDNEPALAPKVAELSDDMLEFAEEPKDLVILDENGHALTSGDHDRRFFEASWMHKYKGKYYFSYSTGNTHRLCYAMGDTPYGPFTYKGVIMNPVVGWTTHHSIVEFKDKWYLFYHDCILSKGVTHLRNIKCIEIDYDEEGLIEEVFPYKR